MAFWPLSPAIAKKLHINDPKKWQSRNEAAKTLRKDVEALDLDLPFIPGWSPNKRTSKFMYKLVTFLENFGTLSFDRIAAADETAVSSDAAPNGVDATPRSEEENSGPVQRAGSSDAVPNRVDARPPSEVGIGGSVQRDGSSDAASHRIDARPPNEVDNGGSVQRAGSSGPASNKVPFKSFRRRKTQNTTGRRAETSGSETTTQHAKPVGAENGDHDDPQTQRRDTSTRKDSASDRSKTADTHRRIVEPSEAATLTLDDAESRALITIEAHGAYEELDKISTFWLLTSEEVGDQG